MNRKDTILMAVVVNAVLLAALFISAIGKSPADEPAAQTQPVAISESKEKRQIKVASGDAIDDVLKDFSEQVKEMPPESSLPKVDFAKELEAITKAATQKAEGVSPQRRDAEVVEVAVASGDSLAKIASCHGTTVEAITAANQLKTTVLQVGQKLRVPSKGATASAASDLYYVVKQGDNPWTIAVKNQIKVDDLLRLNHLNEEKAKRLRPGDRLRIR